MTLMVKGKNLPPLMSPKMAGTSSTTAMMASSNSVGGVAQTASPTAQYQPTNKQGENSNGK